VKILFAASEVFPYAKTGGLGDVAQALPHALSKEHEIVRVMPLYGLIDKSNLKKTKFSFDLSLGSKSYKITIYSDSYNSVITYFIQTDIFSEHKEFYTKKSGAYSNENENFAVFSASIVKLAKILDVDLVHLNDWHTALAALWIKEEIPKVKTLFTIHNLAYQGLFKKEVLVKLGIDERYFNMEHLEFYDKVSFIKAGIAFSDAITTVSPQYAKEILSEEFGCGLHSFLKFYSNKLSGILNGIDYELYDPKNDKALVSNFDEEHIEQKYKNKELLLQKFHLNNLENATFIMVSRLVEQKGFGLVLDSIEEILSKKINLIILADEANSLYKTKLESIAKRYENLAVCFGYDEDLSRQIYAGGDFLLMPSLFEPCGLNQMIAMRYGTIPVVHSVGGLVDTVHEDKAQCGRGIVFKNNTKDALLDALKRSLVLFDERAKMHEIIKFNMSCDFSFTKSASLYSKLYKRLL
jgi:starch synthase